MTAIEPLAPTSALAPRERYLPLVGQEGYHIGDGETLAAALHRLTTEQFTIAIDILSDPGNDVTFAADATMAALQRIVAVLRLVRSVIGPEAYRTELTILTDTSTRLDALLDGRAEITAVDQLLARYTPVLQPDTFSHLRGALVQRHELRRLHALSDSETIDQTLHSLRRARARFAAWPVEGDAARMYGREPIPDEFSAISPGLQTTYKRARRYWQQAESGGAAEASAAWHRETRRLGSQLTLLSTTWPEVVGAMADTCERLGAVLSEGADFATLGDVVAAEPGLCPDRVERSLLDALVAGTSAELHAIAATLGARLFVEPTKLFMARLSAYWSARGLRY